MCSMQIISKIDAAGGQATGDTRFNGNSSRLVRKDLGSVFDTVG